MTAQKFYKRGTITADQFDGSLTMADKYELIDEFENESGTFWALETDKGESMSVDVGDWIVTGPEGEHWPIADDIFRKTYQPLPVIPQAVAYAIEWFQQNDETIGEIWQNLYEDVDDDWQEVPQLREAEEWMLNNQDAFTQAWLMDDWEEEETHEE